MNYKVRTYTQPIISKLKKDKYIRDNAQITSNSANSDIDFDNDQTYTIEDELLEIVNSDIEDDSEDSFFSKIEPCYVEIDRRLKRDGLIT